MKQARTFLLPRLTGSAKVAEKLCPSLASPVSSLSSKRTLISVPGLIDCAKALGASQDKRIPSPKNNRKGILFMVALLNLQWQTVVHTRPASRDPFGLR